VKEIQNQYCEVKLDQLRFGNGLIAQ